MAEETIRTTTTEEKKTSKRSDAIVVDLGKKSSKDVRNLRKGRGRLMDDVQDCVQELQDAGAISPLSQTVIVVVERRLSSRDGLVPFLIPPGISAMLPLSVENDDDEDDDDEDDDD